MDKQVSIRDIGYGMRASDERLRHGIKESA
jgi:hypothetical protein